MQVIASLWLYNCYILRFGIPMHVAVAVRRGKITAVRIDITMYVFSPSVKIVQPKISFMKHLTAAIRKSCHLDGCSHEVDSGGRMGATPAFGPMPRTTTAMPALPVLPPADAAAADRTGSHPAATPS